MTKFKVFYSWQSDLPGNETRYFIRDCIDDAISFAVESEAIEAVRDEATKDQTGSPNIVTSIFSKIDECDLFVADVSLCFTGKEIKPGVMKQSPNPNVLLELGYAAKTLGWDRVVCLSNTDFGEDYPFDIVQNRRFPFSIEGKVRKDVRRYVAHIIFSHIQSLHEQIPRAKAGFSSHIIGSYDFDQKEVASAIIPLDFCNSESFNLHNEEILSNAKNLLAEIQAISKRMESYKVPESPTIWGKKEEDKGLIKRYLNIDVDDTFFNLGNFKLVKPAFSFDKETKHGSEDENNKYDKLLELSYFLSIYELRNKYLETFDGMMYIPLAIKNYSTTADTNIRIIVNVEKGEIVDPSEQLIVKDLDGCQGLLCSDDEPGVISELFILAEDDNVHYDKNQFDYATFTTRSPILTENGFGYPPKTAEDYKTELEWYIASAAGNDFYEFEVHSLRANECCWLGQGLLLKPVDGNITLNYKIHSDHSTGELAGKLELKPNTTEP